MVTPQERFEASLRSATTGITFSPTQLSSLSSLANFNKSSPAERLDLSRAGKDPYNPTPIVAKPALDPPSTNGVTQPFRYSNVLPPLTPQQQRALMERRRAATRSFEETQALVGRETVRAEGDVLRQQGELDRNRRLQSRSGMQTLAGRGVGRSPMFVNPFQRQLTEQSQRQTAELQSGLAGTLSQLRSALQQAEIGRDRELSQIDFDAVDGRSDIGRLLGVQP